jgi:hypothetical protein
MYRVLALCWGVRSDNHKQVRKAIVSHLCDQVQVNGDENTDLFISFMKDVHLQYLGWKQYELHDKRFGGSGEILKNSVNIL